MNSLDDQTYVLALELKLVRSTLEGLEPGGVVGSVVCLASDRATTFAARARRTEGKGETVYVDVDLPEGLSTFGFQWPLLDDQLTRYRRRP